jgi:hypothetical protein
VSVLLCPKCGKKAKLLAAVKYRRDESTWVVFDDAECRGFQCSHPDGAHIFGTPAATYDVERIWVPENGAAVTLTGAEREVR